MKLLSLLLLCLCVSSISANVLIEHSNNNLVIKKPTTVDLGSPESFSCDLLEDNGQTIERCEVTSPLGKKFSRQQQEEARSSDSPVGYNVRAPCTFEIDTVTEQDLGEFHLCPFKLYR